MPKISQKGREMPESPIRKLVPYAEAASAKGIEVLYLNIGQPDITTPEAARNAVKEFDADALAYSHSAGMEELRSGFAEYYKSHGMPVSDGDVLITTGGSEAIQFTLGSITDMGDELIIPEPFYANYNGFSVQLGLQVVPVHSSIENGFALPPIEEFEKKITKRTRAIMICNPGNPTGYLYSEAELEKLQEIVQRHDLYLLSDEVYREFTYDGHRHKSILQLEGLKEHAIVLDSVSKRYSMCGARIGCLVSRNKSVISTALKFGQARLSPPTLSQIASLGALKTPESYFKEVLEEYQNRRNTLVAGLKSIEGVQCPMPKGAFYCVAQLPVEDAETFAKWLLSEFQWEGKTLMFAPNAGFYSTSGLGKDEVRLAYVLKEDKLRQAVEILRNGLAAYQALNG
jgi:aspartate aminotransferase